MNAARLPGEPLRFLVLVLGVWVGVRAVMLWPVPAAVRMVTRQMAATTAAPAIAAPKSTADPVAFVPRVGSPIAALRIPTGQVPMADPVRKPDPDRIALALLGMVRFGAASPLMIPVPREAKRAVLTPASPTPGASGSRWSASAWLVARGPGGPAAGVAGRELGGSQAGVRLAYALDDDRRWALVARFASPLGGQGQEGAVGVEWRPTRLPVRIAVENRIDLQSGRSAPAVGLVGGAGPVTIAPHVTVEGYGQAGIVVRGGVIGYADGAIRVNRRLASLGLADFDLGAGSWGGRQPGVGRLDIGPSLSVSVPVVGHRLRASLDWRERVAGRALPGSGAVLTLGTDF